MVPPPTRGIARDEPLHAELAWAVDAWGSARLAPAARARLCEAHHEALRELERELEQPPLPTSLVREAGLPSREQSLRMLAGLSELGLERPSGAGSTAFALQLGSPGPIQLPSSGSRGTAP